MKKPKQYVRNEETENGINILKIVLVFVIIGALVGQACTLLWPKYEEYRKANHIKENQENKEDTKLVLQEEKIQNTGIREIENQDEPKQPTETDPADNDDYIIPNSNSMYLSEIDVENLNLQQINYAKNEIYARHGRKFKSIELQNYFNAKPWYNGVIEPDNFSDKDFNSYEKENAKFLSEIEYSINPNGYQLD